MDRLVLPLPPSKNKSHHQTNEGGVLRRRKTAESCQFLADAGWLCKAWMRQSGWAAPPYGVKVILRFWCFWPDSMRRDPGNMVDMLLDGLNGVAYVDDQFVLPHAMDYEVDKLRPRVEVELVRMEVSKSG